MQVQQLQVNSIDFPQASKQILSAKNSSKKRSNNSVKRQRQFRQKTPKFSRQEFRQISKVLEPASYHDILYRTQDQKFGILGNKARNKGQKGLNQQKLSSQQLDPISCLIKDRYQSYRTKIQQSNFPIFQSHKLERSTSYRQTDRGPHSKYYIFKAQKANSKINNKSMSQQFKDKIRLSYSPIKNKNNQANFQIKANRTNNQFFKSELQEEYKISSHTGKSLPKADFNKSMPFYDNEKIQSFQRKNQSEQASAALKKINERSYLNKGQRKGVYSGSPYKHQTNLLQKLKRVQTKTRFPNYNKMQVEKQQENEKLIEYYKTKYGNVYLPKKTQKEITEAHDIQPW